MPELVYSSLRGDSDRNFDDSTPDSILQERYDVRFGRIPQSDSKLRCPVSRLSKRSKDDDVRQTNC